MPITKDETRYKVNLDKELDGLSDSFKAEASEIAGQAVLDKLKEYVGKQQSPVSGQGKYKALSSDYKKFKRKTVGNGKANLSLFGDLLESIDVDADIDGFELVIDDPTEVLKSYNHNKGDTIPKRQFIPEDTQKFKRDIIKSYEKKLQEFKKNRIPEKVNKSGLETLIPWEEIIGKD